MSFVGTGRADCRSERRARSRSDECPEQALANAAAWVVDADLADLRSWQRSLAGFFLYGQSIRGRRCERRTRAGTIDDGDFYFLAGGDSQDGVPSGR